MSLALGQRLKIRAMVYVAAEPIPYFWPMRNFIHHNPLHGLEHLPFAEAVGRGERLFHARGYLPRRLYQRYLGEGQVDRAALAAGVDAFLEGREPVPGIHLRHWLMTLLTEVEQPVGVGTTLAGAEDLAAALAGAPRPPATGEDQGLRERLRRTLLEDRSVYEAVDALYGTAIGDDLDELVIKSCLDFFDEGQSVWGMPERDRGFFAAWRELVRRNKRLLLHGRGISRLLDLERGPEDVIAQVMAALEVPEERWPACFSRELARLHGWAGFIRWRSNAKSYYWGARYPGDLVDLLAVRLTLALVLLRENARNGVPATAGAVREAVENRPRETYLRHELHGGGVVPAMASRVERALALGGRRRIEEVFAAYLAGKRDHEAQCLAGRLRELAARAGEADALGRLEAPALAALTAAVRELEAGEGMLWLQALEARAMTRLLEGVRCEPPVPRDKRPFVQALFCIDTRSERIRRNLEAVGDYQTFGIAGFFGVPISFMELGKGSEAHLCPVLLTPRNLVMEMAVAPAEDMAAVTVLEKALHELKESVLGPFVTVEAIGLLFGLDMVGKTLIPQTYQRWRGRLHEHKPSTHLLLDKLSREQADSVVRAVQRAVIEKAVEHELRLPAEHVTDDMVRELREAALGGQSGSPALASALGLDGGRVEHFVRRLREVYRIDASYGRLQLERLARIGFSIEEQTRFVAQALQSIGLTEGLSRFILLVGHGSTSENNPFESALDCGACGGQRGLVNARALAQMANKAEVRRGLRRQGVAVPDDAWFVPALHDTATDRLELHDLERMPSSHVVYLDRLRNGLTAASRLCAQERLPRLEVDASPPRDTTAAYRRIQRNAVDWSQVRPEWGLSRNAYFIIGRRALTEGTSLDGRAFLHSYDYRLDPRRRLLGNILTGPLVVGQWINMEHYFSTVDNQGFGSGSKVYHNVAGRFGVMTGNLSDLRTGLPAQTVLDKGLPYHEPMRLITVIEAPLEHARQAVEDVVTVKNLVRNGWIRLLVIDPEDGSVNLYDDGRWDSRPLAGPVAPSSIKEAKAP